MPTSNINVAVKNPKSSAVSCEIDLHGMTVQEAQKALAKYLSGCSAKVGTVDVIHGCNNGVALMQMVRRDFKHPRLLRKIVSMNGGMTTLLLREKK